MKRDQLDYVQLDIDFLNKPKIKALGFKFGALAQLLVISALLDMGGATNGEIDDDAFNALASIYGFDPQKSIEILNYLLETKILFRADSKKITNSRIIEAQQEVADKRRKWREAKGYTEESSETQDQTKEIPKTIIPDSEEIPNGILKDSKDHKDLNTKVLNINKKEDKPLKNVILGPRLAVTEEQQQTLIEEFGQESLDYYAKTCSDYLLATGRKYKNYAAFMRNWIRKEIAERKGYYHPNRARVLTDGRGPPIKQSPTERSFQAFKNVEKIIENKNLKITT